MGNKVSQKMSPPIHYSDSDDDFENITDSELNFHEAKSNLENFVNDEGFFSDDETDETNDSSDLEDSKVEDFPKLPYEIKKEICYEYNRRFATTFVKNIISDTTNSVAITVGCYDSDSESSVYSDDFEDEISEDEAAFTIVSWLRRIKTHKKNKAAKIITKIVKQYLRTQDLYSDKYRHYDIGYNVDCFDLSYEKVWREARVVNLEKKYAKIHFIGWDSKWDIWVPTYSYKIQPLYSKVVDWRVNLKEGDLLEFKSYDTIKARSLWFKGRVFLRTGGSVTVYGVDSNLYSFNGSVYSEDIMPKLTHIPIKANVSKGTPGWGEIAVPRNPWWFKLKKDDKLEICDPFNNWQEARVSNFNIRRGKYANMSMWIRRRFNQNTYETCSVLSNNISPAGTNIPAWRDSLKIGDSIEINVVGNSYDKTYKENWVIGFITETMNDLPQLTSPISWAKINKENLWLTGGAPYYKVQWEIFKDNENIKNKFKTGSMILSHDSDYLAKLSSHYKHNEQHMWHSYSSYNLKYQDKFTPKIKTWPPQRFKLGDLVELNTEDGWCAGKVITKSENVMWVCPAQKNKRFVKIDLSYQADTVRLVKKGDPSINNEFYKNLRENDIVDVLDVPTKTRLTMVTWREGVIVSSWCSPNGTNTRFKVHYRTWDDKWDEWISIESGRIQPPYTKVKNWRKEIKEGDLIEYKTYPTPNIHEAIWNKGIVSQKRSRGFIIIKNQTNPYYNISTNINSDNIAEKQTHIKNENYWREVIQQTDINPNKTATNYYLDVYMERPLLETRPGETFYNKLSHNRAFTYQNEAYEVMTSIDNKCKDGLYSRHDHSHHIDGIAWQCGFMGSKFIQFNQEECYARASDGCRAAKIYLILDDFLRKHVLKYSYETDELRLNNELIEKRVQVRWAVWCEPLGEYIEEWFKGFIVDYDIESGEHTIEYDDGEVRNYILNDNTCAYEILGYESIKLSLNKQDEEKDCLEDIKQQLNITNVKRCESP